MGNEDVPDSHCSYTAKVRFPTPIYSDISAQKCLWQSTKAIKTLSFFSFRKVLLLCYDLACEVPPSQSNSFIPQSNTAMAERFLWKTGDLF